MVTRNEADQMLNLLNYGSAFCPVPDSGSAVLKGTGQLPFTELVGYSKNVSIASGGGLVLEKPGTWNITGKIAVGESGSFQGDYSPTIVNILVTSAAGVEEAREITYMPANFHKEYSLSGSTEIGYSLFVEGRYGTSTSPFALSVQVKKPGSVVTVRVTNCRPERRWLGGPSWNRLTAQMVSDTIDDNAATGGTGAAP